MKDYSLTPETERLIEKHMRSGRYRSPGDLIAAALRLLDRRKERRAELEALRRDIQVGIDELDQGKGIPAEQAFADIREAVRARTGR